MPFLRRRRFIFSATVGYAVLASIWIFFSDYLLSFFTDGREVFWLSVAKGLVFVAVTTALLYLVLQAQAGEPADEFSRLPEAGLKHRFAWPFRGRRVTVYAFAVVASLAMLWVRMELSVSFGEGQLLILFMFPIVLSALLGGLGPGLVSTLVSAAGVDYWGTPPLHSFSISDSRDLLQWGALVVNGALISILSEALHRAYRRSELQHEVLRIATAELGDSEQRLRLAQDAAQAGAWEWRVETNENYWSDEIWALYGLPFRGCPASYENWLLAIHPDDREKTAGIVKSAAQRGIEFEAEWRVHMPAEAAQRWLMGRGRPVRDEQGRITHYIGIVIDITTRKRAEQALRESEKTYHSLFEHMLNGFAYCRMLFEEGQPVDFIYLGVNKAFESLTGLKHVIGRPVSEVVPGIRESNPLLFERFGRVALGGGPETFESYVESLGMWFSISVYSPKPEHFVAIFEVITQKKLAEQAAERERSRLQTILRTASDGIHILDATGRLVDANKAFLEMLGYDETAIGRLHIDDWEAESAPDLVMERLGSLIASHGRIVFETRNRRSDGQILEVEISACVIDIDGQPLIYASSRNITERKRNAEELERHRHHLEELVAARTEALSQANRALADRADEVADLYNHAPCGYHSLDGEGRFVSINDTELAWLGYSRAEIVGRLHFRDVLAPHGIPAFEQHFQRFKELGHTEGLEFDLLRKDGSILPVLLSATAILDAAGNFVQSRSTLFDMTERKRAEEQIRIAAVAFQSRDGMMVTDTRAVILRVNRSFSEVTGYSAEEVVGKTPAILGSGRQDAAFFRNMWEAIRREGYWQGKIWNRRKDGGVYPEWLAISAIRDSSGQVTHYFGEFSDISEPREAERKIIELAFYDPLTGLPNRRLLMDRLHQALAGSARNDRFGALLLLDLDHFKTLNDTRGHDVGDQLLIEVGRRLSATLRETDTAARLGGDEFVVLLEDMGREDVAAANTVEGIAEKLRAALGQPCILQGTPCHIGASIGITLFNHPAESVENLLKQADLALYQAKDAGRNTIRFYNPTMQAAVDAQVELEGGLRRALAEDELILFYQPQVDWEGRLIGAEALLRWQPPGKQMISPADFIPVAEDTGLILPIGSWVLATACRQIAAWAALPVLRDLRVSVNISAQQFRQADFVAQVSNALKESGADPTRLKLELTESSVVENVEEVRRTMQVIKALGVGFSMDDFGTGYSSLANLKRLPLEQLKIDRSFVRDIPADPDDCAIARAVIALGQNLHLDVIAEGVETEAQRDFLAMNGCRAYQGYLFGRPGPATAMEALAQEKAPAYQ